MEGTGDHGARTRSSMLQTVESSQFPRSRPQGKVSIRCYEPAFFSWRVISCQLTFIRSLRAIHRSACCCGGIPSHRFSMPARVGFDIAWIPACRFWCCRDSNRQAAAGRCQVFVWIRCGCTRRGAELGAARGSDRSMMEGRKKHCVANDTSRNGPDWRSYRSEQL